MGLDMRKSVFGVSTKSDSNQPLQLQKLIIPPTFKPKSMLFPSFQSSIRPSVCLFVRIVLPLHQSFGKNCSSGVYLSNHLSESIHIWFIVTLGDWL